MHIRRLYTLLVVWCGLLTGPAVLVELGTFGRIGVNTTIPGVVILLWIGGYLAQLAVFMWIANIVGKQSSLSVGAQAVWWIVASLLPWAIDWTLPVSPLLILMWLPIAIGLTGWIALVARRAESLREHGIRAIGVVLEVLKPRMNVVVNDVYIKRKLRLRIERQDGVPPYKGVLNGLFMLGEIPSAGDRIPLLVDPAKPQRFEYENATGTTPSAPIRSPALSAVGRDSIADELEKLTDLRDRGAITDSEFDAAKKKLLR